MTIDGVPQIVLLSGDGATSVSPADGKVLWEHSWPGGAIVQPAMTADGDVLINTLTRDGRPRHTPPCRCARIWRMDGGGAVDVNRTEAIFQ